MKRVLDDRLPGGTVGAERHLRVPRFAWSPASYEAAVETIELLCEQMGAVSDLLIPDDTTEETRPWYVRLANTSVLDGAIGDTARKLTRGLAGSPYRRPPAIIQLGGIDPERRRPVHVALPPSQDPWHLAYLAAFGALAQSPNREALTYLGLRQDLQFDDSVDMRRMSPASAGADDLATRLCDGDVVAPLYLSLYRLTSHPIQTNDSWALDGWLQDSGVWARTESSAIVVVYTPSDLADLCLIWNLRAAHGWGNWLPLAVPNLGPAAAADAIATVVSAMSRPGWRPRVNLVSESVDRDALTAIAAALPSQMRGTVFVPDQLLVPAVPPSRTAATTVVLANGAAAVPTRSDHDRAELARLAQLRRPEPDFVLTVTAHDEPVAECPLLRADHDDDQFRHTGGGPVVDASADTLQRVRWPSGWTQLAACCRAAGVTATPSQAGRTSLALMNAIGDIWQVRWLAHRPLLALLYDKAASRGISWWKARADKMARQVAQAGRDPDAALEAFQRAIAEVAVSRSDDMHTLTFSELVQTLGDRAAAEAWLDWAEARGLVLRGASVRCPHCTHRQWRAMTELAPPLTCPGCGRSDRAPFPHASLNFAYRISEPLRRAIENDSIYHLLVARSLLVLLEGGPVPVVGIHPGVDLSPDSDPSQRAEADVLVLFADGSIVPVEVKRSSRGFTDHDLERLDAVATWLASSAVIVAACEPDAELADAFVALERCDADPVRRLLSANDWLDPYNVSTMERTFPGPGAVARPETADQSDAQFAARLLERKPAQPVRDPVAARLKPQP